MESLGSFLVVGASVFGGWDGRLGELSSSWINICFPFLVSVVEAGRDGDLKVEVLGRGDGIPFTDGVVVDFCAAEDVDDCFSGFWLESLER